MSKELSEEEKSQMKQGAENFNSFMQGIVNQELNRKALEKMIRVEVKKLLRKRLQSIIGINSELLNALDDSKIDELLTDYIGRFSK